MFKEQVTNSLLFTRTLFGYSRFLFLLLKILLVGESWGLVFVFEWEYMSKLCVCLRFSLQCLLNALVCRHRSNSFCLVWMFMDSEKPPQVAHCHPFKQANPSPGCWSCNTFLIMGSNSQTSFLSISLLLSQSSFLSPVNTPFLPDLSPLMCTGDTTYFSPERRLYFGDPCIALAF